MGSDVFRPRIPCITQRDALIVDSAREVCEEMFGELVGLNPNIKDSLAVRKRLDRATQRIESWLMLEFPLSIPTADIGDSLSMYFVLHEN